MTIPCRKDCPRRTATCHADCADYAAWSALHKAARAKDLQRKAADVVNIENCQRVKDRIRRRTKR